MRKVSLGMLCWHWFQIPRRRFHISAIIYIVVLGLCLSPLLCNAFTHWFLENGRIQSEANSIFRLHTPADLQLFISQSKAADELRTLEKKSQQLIKQQHLLQSVETLEQLDSERLLTDPDCKITKKKLSKFDLYLSSFLRLEAKKIRIEDFLDYNKVVSSEKEEPYCDSEFLFSMNSYDHLKGVADRKNLLNSSEYGLVNPIPQAKDLPDFGERIKRALTKNATSWVLLNFAAIYWRIAGNSLNAVECLRRALHYSPRAHKDLALVSLANVLHRSKYSLDAAILMHAALEITSDFDIVYFTLGNIYGALGQFDLADICFKYVCDLQPGFEAARLRMHAAKCEHKFTAQLDVHQRKVESSLEGIEEGSLKQQIIEDQQKDLLAHRSSPLRKYDLNFGQAPIDGKVEEPKT